MPVVASANSKAIDLTRRRARTKRKGGGRSKSGRAGLSLKLPWLRAIISAGVVAALGGGGFIGWQAWREGLPQKLEAAVADAGEGLRSLLPFRLDEVTVDGRKYVSREAILRALDVARGDVLLAMDLGALRSRLEQIDWVEYAAVERRLPNTLHVTLRERVAVAIWQRGPGDFILIDRNGRTVRASAAPPGYESLLLVGGEGAPQQIGELFLLLAVEPGIAKRLTAASWVGQRRWNLYLQGGIEVRLPEEDALAALQRLATLDRTDGLLSRELTVIDMRLPDKLILRRVVTEPPEPDPKAATPAPGAKPPANPSPGRPTTVAGRPT
jgi:cell division protein FtsQ